MTVNEYCLFLLLSENLSDKLTPPPFDIIDTPDFSVVVPDKPNRENKIIFSDKKSKIPRLEHLNQKINRAFAIHHFANHELMALEIFAWALLKFQNIDPLFRRDLFKTLKEEQKHLSLYINRINELGLDFGDKPLNSIFWKFTSLMTTFDNFSSIMSLSLEGANLDFATLYSKVFEINGDTESARIMDIIYKDELSHVKRGLRVIQKNKSSEISDWDYYSQNLVHPFTPRRAKGYFYFPNSRKKVGFSEEFIQKLGEYRDEFSNRKKEVIPEELKSWGIYSD
jgi:uncharacterized ferritin-like protein (DUF455 family)